MLKTHYDDYPHHVGVVQQELPVSFFIAELPFGCGLTPSPVFTHLGKPFRFFSAGLKRLSLFSMDILNENSLFVNVGFIIP